MRHRRHRSLALAALSVLLLTAGTAGAGDGADATLLGFTAASSAEQRVLEERFDALLRVENLEAWAERLDARPHPVGSPWGKQNAELMAELFRSWGYDTRVEEFRVLFPTPKVRHVEMIEPTPFTASLEEPAIPGLTDTESRAEQLPLYNAYSVDGDVTGELVYVNYGRPEDYDVLRERGVSVDGKIAIARYGGAWRGIKPKVAAEHGAVGCIIYSDPRDDGFYHGDTYPEGGYRPATGGQRGSVADMPLFPGDPLTPGEGATADAERLPREEAPTLTKIPVLPISWEDARPLLAAMAGPVAPPEWRGSLPLTYHLGPGPAKVRLHVEFDWQLEPAYDVIAVLRGSEHPDQWVLRGNHHDAWVHGATDPVSGIVALLEEARAVGELAKAGHPPKRTIVYAGWDAEEPGLLGSVEWAEEHAAELSEKAVAYVNSDSNSRGFLNVGGSHTLERMVNEVARAVDDPQTDLTVAERSRAALDVAGTLTETERPGTDDRKLYPLGSGSDYTPFLQHLGIASLNVGYGGEGHYGQYHSAYDTIDHFRRFMDPGHAYGVALAQTAGRIVLRLANADLLPFAFEALADEVGGYVDEVAELTDTMRRETAETSRRLDAGLHTAAADPLETYVPPAREAPVPHLDFSPLRNASDRLDRAAAAYSAALAALEGRQASEWPPEETLAEVDRILFRSERALTRAEGLPGREWYVHHLYAPGFYTGYGVKTLPGVREAIEQREWDQVETQVEVAAGVIENVAAEVERAAALLTQ